MDSDNKHGDLTRLPKISLHILEKHLVSGVIRLKGISKIQIDWIFCGIFYFFLDWRNSPGFSMLSLGPGIMTCDGVTAPAWRHLDVQQWFSSWTPGWTPWFPGSVRILSQVLDSNSLFFFLGSRLLLFRFIHLPIWIPTLLLWGRSRTFQHVLLMRETNEGVSSIRPVRDLSGNHPKISYFQMGRP